MLGGRFNRSFLDSLVWQDYNKNEQEMFLGMMVEVGLIFKLSEKISPNPDYLAPDFLPDASDVDAADAFWNEETRALKAQYLLKFIHPAFLRNIQSNIGAEAKRAARYWKNGLNLYDARGGTAARISLTREDDWSGILTLETQNGDAKGFAFHLHNQIDKIAKQLGLDYKLEADDELNFSEEKLSINPAFLAAKQKNQPDEKDRGPIYALPDGAQKDFAVSYAWGDDSDDGIEHEKRVAQACEAADEKGIRILWDKRDVGLGDSLKDFMERIGKAHRLLIFLNSRYLLRPNTMNELYTAWVHNGQDASKFKSATRFYIDDDFDKGSPQLRAAGFGKDDSLFKTETQIKVALYWKKQFDLMQKLIGNQDASVLGAGFIRHVNQQKFANSMMDILHIVTDTVQPRLYNDFLENSFADIAEELT